MESKTRSPPLLLQFILNKYLIYLLHCNIYISIYYVAIALNSVLVTGHWETKQLQFSELRLRLSITRIISGSI